MNGQEPPLAQTDPKAYYLWLQTQGMGPAQAVQLVQQRFGPPKSQEEQAKDQASQEQKNALAQTGGAVLGTVGGQYLARKIGGLFDSSATKATTGTTVATPNLKGATKLGSVNTNTGAATPQVISTKGATSTIQTPTGPQQVPTESLNDPGFWSNVNWGQVAQGGLSLAQIYSAYQAYKSGDKTGAAIQGAAGAGNLAAATGAVATGQAAGTTGAYVIPGLNILAGAYSGYQTAEAMGDMAAGAKRTRTGVVGGATSGAAIGAGVGSIVPGVGTAIGAGVGAVVGAIAGAAGSVFGSSKGKGQMQRDAIRGVLQERGLLNENFQGTLANGTLTDFGQDGSKLNTKAMNKLQSENPNAFETTQQLGDAIAASYGFVGDKARSLSRLYVRAALSNAKDNSNTAIANMQHFAKQQGITSDLLQTNLTKALQENRISQNEFNRLNSAAQQLVSGSNVTPIPRPKKGEVGRQSAGLYRDDTGKLIRAASVKEALRKAYNKTIELPSTPEKEEKNQTIRANLLQNLRKK